MNGPMSGILPPHVSCREQLGPPSGSLVPEEERLLGEKTVHKRREEFAAGRTCARSALAALGVQPGPILPGQEREPLWPAGIVGSITHCAGYSAAAVALRTDYASIGIDAEPNEPLPAETLNMIASAVERIWIRNAPDVQLCRDRLVFSAKESVYKVWYPITRCWLDFSEAEIEFDVAGGSFQAQLSPRNRLLKDVPRSMSGRFAVTETLLVSCAWLTA